MDKFNVINPYSVNLSSYTHEDSVVGHYAIYRDFDCTLTFNRYLTNKQKVFGYEALVRVHNSKGQLVSPDKFFSVIRQRASEDALVNLLCLRVHFANFAKFKSKDNKLFVNIAPTIFENVTLSRNYLKEKNRSYERWVSL